MRTPRPARVLALALLLLLPLGCSEPRDSPEAEVERTLLAGEAALEARQLDELGRFVARDYRDDRGRDRKTLLRVAQLVFMQGPVQLWRVNTEIEATAETARARFTVHAVQGAEAPTTVLEQLPHTARSFRVVMDLVWEDDAWRVRRIEGIGDGGL